MATKEKKSAKHPRKKDTHRAPGQMHRRGVFTWFAEVASRAAGSPIAFVIAAGVIVVWAATGPLFGFSDTWQIVINTATTIITFLLVFLIQSSQNRDTRALHIKLDELLRATKGAHTALLDLEMLSEEELCIIQNQYKELAVKAREEMRKGREDTGVLAIALEKRE
jgi:low affinity Fe/Cu permease